MALVAFGIFKLMKNKTRKLPARLIGGILAEIVMVGGYFVFEGFLYGFGASLVNVPANAIQGVAGILLSIPLVKVFERVDIIVTK